ncbi:hypothetical protein EDD85DRAFT_146571 [Armillaria nabsnona]|nr:hypothetical protein EDD85DRAFT_146571 [Armillaria nabsnona]
MRMARLVISTYSCVIELVALYNAMLCICRRCVRATVPLLWRVYICILSYICLFQVALPILLVIARLTRSTGMNTWDG